MSKFVTACGGERMPKDKGIKSPAQLQREKEKSAAKSKTKGKK